MQVEGEEDPFGPYEFVETWNQCSGYGDRCMWNRCSGQGETCKCMCPVCVGDDPHTWGYDGDH